MEPPPVGRRPEGPVGGVLSNVRSYSGDRNIHIFQHPARRDPKGSDPSLRHPDVSHRVALRLVAHIVGASVNLDRQV